MCGARIAFIGMKNAQKNAIIQTVFVFITDGANQIGSVLTENARKDSEIGVEELKPCPFCGGKAKVAKVHPSFMLKKLHNLYFAAGCPQCGVSTAMFKTYKTGSPMMNEWYDDEAKQKAIEAWNKRV